MEDPAEPSKGEPVDDAVMHLNAAFNWSERMRMLPNPVGPSYLEVRELIRLVDGADPGLPTGGDPPQGPYPIVDQHSFIEFVFAPI